MDDSTLKEIFAGLAEALDELDLHLMVIRRVLIDKGLVSTEEYKTLFLTAEREVRKQSSEINELHGLLELEQPPASERQ